LAIEWQTFLMWMIGTAIMREVVMVRGASHRPPQSFSLTIPRFAIIDLLTRQVTRAGRDIELTSREFQLLEHLARNPGRVLTRAQICERVWEYDFDPGTNVVDVYIQRLRRKLEAPISCNG